MDSDESRPGSSASNSSESSVDSRPSSPPAAAINNSEPRKSRSKSAESNASGSRSSSSDSSGAASNRSGPKSPSNGGDERHSKSRSESPQVSDEERSDRSRSASKESNHSNNRSSADDDEDEPRRGGTAANNQSVSRNQSMSPVRKSNSPLSHSNSPKSRTMSRNSNASSNENLKTDEISDTEIEAKDDDDDDDDVNEKPVKPVDTLNISHDDLSDVSDLESPPPSDNEEAEEEEELCNKVADKVKIGNAAAAIEEDGEEDEEGGEGSAAEKQMITDLRQKLDKKKNQLKSMEDRDDKQNGGEAGGMHTALLDKKHDEDALDFEVEEGECDLPKEEAPVVVVKDPIEPLVADKTKNDEELEDGEELEEGEVSDEDEKRPEETEPKPVCRFYTRGQCTWGMSCRFLHPGVTDKGNYTMFDMVRPVPIPHGGVPPYAAPGGFHDYRAERPPIHHQPPMHHPAYGGGPPAHSRPPIVDPAAGESAWERGLRTAKEMMRKANKRKEQDMDFEDKKMNLSMSQDELEKDNYYIRDNASPDLSPPYGGGGSGGGGVGGGARHPMPPAGPYESEGFNAPHKYMGRGPPGPMGGEPEVDPYGRVPRYRELPPHRMPQYEDEILPAQRRIRPAREVIVQRAEPVGRGDEWNDPWMRSKSPGRERKRRDRRSYSSNSSYSSTTYGFTFLFFSNANIYLLFISTQL